jgi:hypothetical protein
VGKCEEEARKMWEDQKIRIKKNQEESRRIKEEKNQEAEEKEHRVVEG